MRVILASKSPRRKEILGNLGLKFDIIVADADESSDIRDPELLVQELARIKGRAVLERLDRTEEFLLIACDTLVYAEGEFLGKPKDKADANRMMHLLSGKAHLIVSGLYLNCCGKEIAVSAVTKVCFDQLTECEIEEYISTDEPYDKAGGYAVQGKACVFVNGLDGDYFNVVGLPVNLLYRTLKEAFGIDIRNL